MKTKHANWKQRKEPPSFPKWLTSFHLLLMVLIIILAFGGIIKWITN